jgi:hypothetical protein
MQYTDLVWHCDIDTRLLQQPRELPTADGDIDPTKWRYPGQGGYASMHRPLLMYLCFICPGPPWTYTTIVSRGPSRLPSPRLRRRVVTFRLVRDCLFLSNTPPTGVGSVSAFAFCPPRSSQTNNRGVSCLVLSAIVSPEWQWS